MAEMGWPRFAMNFQDLKLYNQFQTLDQNRIDKFLKSSISDNTPASLNRMVAAFCTAIGTAIEDDDQANLPPEQIYELVYQNGINLLIKHAQETDLLGAPGEEMAYPFAIPNLPETNMPYIEPLAMWQAVLGDLLLNTPKPVMAARFINGLTKVIAKMALKLARTNQEDTHLPILLTGPPFENQHVHQLVSAHLAPEGVVLFTPQNQHLDETDLAIGQVAIGAAQNLKKPNQKKQGQKTKANHKI